jgi:hypothetical protein
MYNARAALRTAAATQRYTDDSSEACFPTLCVLAYGARRSMPLCCWIAAETKGPGYATLPKPQG